MASGTHRDITSANLSSPRSLDCGVTAPPQRCVQGIIPFRWRPAAPYDFSTARTIVAVAGGDGILIATILRRNPALHATLFELEHVRFGANETGPGNRLAMRPGGRRLLQGRAEAAGGGGYCLRSKPPMLGQGGRHPDDGPHRWPESNRSGVPGSSGKIRLRCRTRYPEPRGPQHYRGGAAWLTGARLDASEQCQRRLRRPG